RGFTPFSPGHALDAVVEGVQQDGPDDVAAVAGLAVEVVRVPLAEDVVGPAVDGVAVVVGPRVQGQLVQQLRVEAGVLENGRVGRAQDRQGLFGQVVVAARGHAGAAQV